MFKIYSRGCEYALRALTTLPAQETYDRFSVSTLSRKCRIPEAFTRKAFQLLSQKHILRATTGPGGGYRFAKHPRDISLLEIIYAIEGEDSFNHCILGLPSCNSAMPCPIHNLWADMKDGMIEELKTKTLYDLMLLNERRRFVKQA